MNVIYIIIGCIMMVLSALSLFVFCAGFMSLFIGEFKNGLIIIMICLIISVPTMYIHMISGNDYHLERIELVNIEEYEGLATVKDGKYSYDYMYFVNGEDILKISPNLVKIKSTNAKELKVIYYRTVYDSKFKYFALDMDGRLERTMTTTNISEYDYFEVYLTN